MSRPAEMQFCIEIKMIERTSAQQNRLTTAQPPMGWLFRIERQDVFKLPIRNGRILGRNNTPVNGKNDHTQIAAEFEQPLTGGRYFRSSQSARADCVLRFDAEFQQTFRKIVASGGVDLAPAVNVIHLTPRSA